ncbi:MAG: GspH/FimT family pseudopilin [Gammaproteobacteria bacterium]|nr:GspH/FimT family pseudopilin [Gammaproteobacteria bacterium]
MNKTNGLTLIEVMVALVIASILLFSAPSFVNIIKNSEQTSHANSLLFALTNARDESIKRNSPVSVCQSEDGLECTDSGWDNGWIVFVDQNDPGSVDGDDTVLQVFGGMYEEASLTSDNFPDFITYLSDGTSDASGNFVMCDDRGADHALALCISATGRANVSHTNCAGGAIECL